MTEAYLAHVGPQRVDIGPNKVSLEAGDEGQNSQGLGFCSWPSFAIIKPSAQLTGATQHGGTSAYEDSAGGLVSVNEEVSP